jgi:hypothetical protein
MSQTALICSLQSLLDQLDDSVSMFGNNYLAFQDKKPFAASGSTPIFAYLVSAQSNRIACAQVMKFESHA